MVWEWAGMIGSILLLDLALSGDNALVLGAAAAGLPRRQRWYALIFGGAGAIVLRILFSSLASFILNILWLQTVGALILMVIAIRLLGERVQSQEDETEKKAKGKEGGEISFRTAALTILVADITMSLDNVLAIGAAANGNFVSIIFGLLISIAIIICGSAIVAELMNRMAWLLDLAAVILAWTSATMIHDDLYLFAERANIRWLANIGRPSLPLHLSLLVLILGAITITIVLIFDAIYYRRAKKLRQV